MESVIVENGTPALQPKKRVTPRKNAAKKPRTTTKSAPVKKKALPKPTQKTSSKPKTEKPKLVRDSFTIPEIEYQVLSIIKKAIIRSGMEVKKTELIRVGLAMVARSSIPVLKKELSKLQQIKSGRPKNN